jgi:hypothetical protein
LLRNLTQDWQKHRRRLKKKMMLFSKCLKTGNVMRMVNLQRLTKSDPKQLKNSRLSNKSRSNKML